ncbi:hypothetical protein NXH76_02845 [Blautia schinkii]|nr:hypothetical protein [Blautia schinkii]
MQEPELIDFDSDFQVNMYRQVSSEFVRSGSPTQTTQSPTKITRTVASNFAKKDKAALALVHK